MHKTMLLRKHDGHLLNLGGTVVDDDTLQTYFMCGGPGEVRDRGVLKREGRTLTQI